MSIRVAESEVLVGFVVGFLKPKESKSQIHHQRNWSRIFLSHFIYFFCLLEFLFRNYFYGKLLLLYERLY